MLFQGSVRYKRRKDRLRLIALYYSDVARLMRGTKLRTDGYRSGTISVLFKGRKCLCSMCGVRRSGNLIKQEVRRLNSEEEKWNERVDRFNLKCFERVKRKSLSPIWRVGRLEASFIQMIGWSFRCVALMLSQV